MPSKTPSVFRAALLICGITLGVGMLGLPVATAESGFLPSVMTYIVCWAFMFCTGLLVLEACQYVPHDSNLITMSRHLLGKGGSAICWALYLFLFTGLMIAHFAGAGQIVQDVSQGTLNYWQSMVVFMLILWPFIYMGTRLIDHLNVALMIALAITYVLFIAFSAPRVQSSFLMQGQWNHTFFAIPVVFTAFGYQTLIPTLLRYMNRNVSKVRQAICIGSLIPLVIYIIWQLLISGIIPKQMLLDANAKGISAVTPLSQILQNPYVLFLGNAFAVLTLTTSYLGISVGYLDFLADGFRMAHHPKNRFFLCCLIFIIPLIISLINPGLFLKALSVSGGIGVALLLGMLPVAMIWNARRRHGHQKIAPVLKGGKLMLGLLFLFSLMVVLIEIF